jgi:hypothetical protein
LLSWRLWGENAQQQMSYAGPGGNVAVITRTAPHDGFRGRATPNPTGHASMVASPLPYRLENPNEPETRYCDQEVNGIIPGYGGHRPRAQHCYGHSSFGDPHGVSHAGELRKNSQGKLERGGEDAFASGFANGVGIDGRMQGHPDAKVDSGVWAEGIPEYAKQVGGVLPGYGGHVPRSIHKYGASAVGATPQFGGSYEHEEVAELRRMFSRTPEVRGLENGDYPRSDPNDDGEEWWPHSPPKAAIEGFMTDYRQQINGVLPKYAGHVPRSKDKYGASAHGYTRTVAGQSRDTSNSGVRTEGVVMGQVNRENTKAEVRRMRRARRRVARQRGVGGMGGVDVAVDDRHDRGWRRDTAAKAEADGAWQRGGRGIGRCSESARAPFHGRRSSRRLWSTGWLLAAHPHTRASWAPPMSASWRPSPAY